MKLQLDLSLVIGHRITIKQKQALTRRMAEDLGEAFSIEGEICCAFPAPQVLQTISAYKGLSAQKVERVRAVARAAIKGVLDRHALRSIPVTDAISRLESLPGIGPFFAQGILEIAHPWRPFRMWAAVLLHVWIRREIGLPGRRGH